MPVCSFRPAAALLNGKWGFINEKGEEVIPFIYEDTTYFHKDYVAVKKDGKWGFINQKGERIIPFLYDDASYFTEGLALVKKDDKYGYINDKNETVLPFIYDAERSEERRVGKECRSRWSPDH